MSLEFADAGTLEVRLWSVPSSSIYGYAVGGVLAS